MEENHAYVWQQALPFSTEGRAWFLCLAPGLAHVWLSWAGLPLHLPTSVLLADRATGRINTGNNRLLQPHNLKTTLQKAVCSPASPRELALHFLLRKLRFLLIGRELLAL